MRFDLTPAIWALACWICLAQVNISIHLRLQRGYIVAMGLARTSGFPVQDQDSCPENHVRKAFTLGCIEVSPAGIGLVLKGLVGSSWETTCRVCVHVCV